MLKNFKTALFALSDVFSQNLREIQRKLTECNSWDILSGQHEHMAWGAVHFDRYRGIIEGKGLTLACPRMISQLSPSKNLAIHSFLEILSSRISCGN